MSNSEIVLQAGIMLMGIVAITGVVILAVMAFGKELEDD